MNNLNYIELGRQKYLEELDVNHAKIVLNFRTRMAKFSGNFKGNGTVENCPLQGLHSDLQHLSFEFPEIVKQVEIKVTYESILKPEISVSLAKTPGKIVNLRKNEE